MASWLESLTGGTTAGSVHQRHSDTDMWTRYARHAATALRAGTGLPEITVYGPVFAPGERAFFQTTANYARMYGGDGTYTTTGMLALASPAVMLGAFAAAGIINHRRKTRARRDAAVQWRGHEHAGLIATSHRLMLHTARHGWTSFYYGGITEVYPDIDNSSLTMGFGKQAPPMMLAGPPIPAVAVVVAAATMPDRWTRDPRLEVLLSPVG